MQRAAIEKIEERLISRAAIAKAIARSPSAVGAALNSRPAKESPTLRAIYKYLTQPAERVSRLSGLATVGESTDRPITSEQLASALRELADLLSPQQPQ